MRCENGASGDANEPADECRSIAISHPSSVTVTSRILWTPRESK